MVKHHSRQTSVLRGKLQTVARQLRHEPTPAEDLLWQRLRGSRLSGYKFHRQYCIDRFIVDFYCSEAALVIEVDGEVHKQQVAADLEREQILNELGYRVIRFTNAQVIGQPDHVLQQILAVLSSRDR